MKTYNQLILTHLIEKGPITSNQALSLYGTSRLADVIWNLRTDYHVPIKTEMREHLSRTGRKGQHGVYTLSCEVEDLPEVALKLVNLVLV